MERKSRGMIGGLFAKNLTKFMENKNYKILEHPADVKVQVFGKTKEELFLNAMLGMMEVLKVKSKKLKVKRKISVKSLDLNALLVDFLSEVLYLSQVNKEVYDDVKFSKFSPSTRLTARQAGSGQTILEAELLGTKIESFGEDIKAVTYHGLEIKKNKKGLYEATVLFDI